MCSIPHGPLQPSACTARMKAGTSKAPVPQISRLSKVSGRPWPWPVGVAVVELDADQVLQRQQLRDGGVGGAAALGVPDVEDQSTVGVARRR